MLVGYARTSTLEQVAGLEAQRETLSAIGCERLYEEQTSSVGVREALKAAMDYVREGDTLIVTKLDRLARSVRHLGEIVDALEAKKVGLRVLDLGLDTSNATGKLMLNVLGAVAQFEREMMLERQREGIAKAKAEGKYRGRKPTALSQERKVLSLVETGMSNRQIAQAIGISERSVYRVKGGNPRHLSAAQTQASSGRDDATLRVDLERIEALTAS
ncbi:recombinase family protein [Cereibacter sphaeroides]|uniref:recombinase family protein n=3 Tax=Cereibacter sphaeroides TaxID=1063 RepID=UPI002D808972|nr:recombinase family protein [Cereibacter sphaeroides]